MALGLQLALTKQCSVKQSRIHYLHMFEKIVTLSKVLLLVSVSST